MTDRAPSSQLEDVSGIQLETFSPANADLVLSWRNDPVVQINSLDNRGISHEAHLGFLEKLELNSRLRYYIVRIDGQALAVLNLDMSGSDAYWGCYLAPAAAPRPGLFPLLVLLAGHMAFSREETASLRSDVLAHNLAPQKMNQFLGIEETGRRSLQRVDGSGVEVIEYKLNRADFEAIQQKAAKLLTRRLKELVAEFSATASRKL